MNDELNNNGHHQIDEEDDELIRLVTSNADASSQYIVFRNGADELYAINVAKVEELIALKDIDIAKNSSAFALIEGVAKIRGNMVSVVVFDRWLGKPELSIDEYELAMMCNYGNHRIGLVIKNVLGVINIESKDFQDNSDNDAKTAYVTDITLGRVSGLCFVFDSDKMLLEVFPKIENDEHAKVVDVKRTKHINGKLLHAEDSGVIRSVVKALYDQLQIDYELFKNGQLLLDRIATLSSEEVSLIITDIEMPIMDGLGVMSAIKAIPGWEEVPIVVNTNMANTSITNKAYSLGAQHIINKLDIEDLSNVIYQYSR
jgi:two-component system chemotaxis response regulator CheV